MELKTLCVILCITVWEVTSLHVEGPPITRLRPCLGRLYFDWLFTYREMNDWKCIIDLVQYTDHDDVTVELRFEKDIYLTFMSSSNAEVIIRKFEPYTIYTKRPIPSQLEFNFKQYGDDLPRLLEFTVDNVTLCNDAVQETLLPKYNKINYVEKNHCGKKVFRHELGILLKKEVRSSLEWPWHVAVVANKTKICGGSIVSRTAVVTVDYCVQNVQTNQVEVIAGTTVPLSHLDQVERQVYQAKEILVSTEDKGYTEYKLAIIKVDGFVFSNNVRPICLFNAEQSNLFGNEVLIVGFGGWTRRNFRLHAFNTIVQDNSDYKNITIEHVRGVNFCSELGPLSSSYADNGNAGSALVVSTVAFGDRITWFLRGLDYTCLPSQNTTELHGTSKFGLFIDIAPHYNWIKAHSGL